jgi:hypothetical protein
VTATTPGIPTIQRSRPRRTLRHLGEQCTDYRRFFFGQPRNQQEVLTLRRVLSSRIAVGHETPRSSTPNDPNGVAARPDWSGVRDVFHFEVLRRRAGRELPASAADHRNHWRPLALRKRPYQPRTAPPARAATPNGGDRAPSNVSGGWPWRSADQPAN